MTKRITLTSGDYISLSDIPNEQMFNLVKGCFINAGFNDNDGKCAQWYNREGYKNLGAGLSKWTLDVVEFTEGDHKRQLSLSDIFNSVNGGFNWRHPHTNCIYIDESGRIKYSLEGLRPNLLRIKQGDGYNIVSIVERIPDSPESIIPPKTSQWWDYEKGVAVGLPEKGEVVSQNGKEYEVLRATVNDTNDNIVLLCLNVNRPDTSRNIFWGNVRDIKPLDYKSPKQVAVDKAFACLSEFRSADQVLGELYDKGMLQVI